MAAEDQQPVDTGDVASAGTDPNAGGNPIAVDDVQIVETDDPKVRVLPNAESDEHRDAKWKDVVDMIDFDEDEEVAPHHRASEPPTSDKHKADRKSQKKDIRARAHSVKDEKAAEGLENPMRKTFFAKLKYEIPRL